MTGSGADPESEAAIASEGAGSEILPSASKRPRPIDPGLYLVATPIGNLEDITLRALRVLREADQIACEDTRQTQKLLHHFGLRTPTVSYHRHNERVRSTELLRSLQGGARVAVVSDAGTPGIADPGAEIVSAAIAAGIPVYAVPGASAVLAAVTASGMASPETGAFRFHGFLPSRSGERRTALERLAKMDQPAAGALEVFYETPHRIHETLADIEAIFGRAQPIALARELTKLHEEFLRGTVAELRDGLGRRGQLRGEMVLLLGSRPAQAPATALTPSETTLTEEIAGLIRTESLSEMEAVKQVARRRGLGKSEAYREWQRRRR